MEFHTLLRVPIQHAVVRRLVAPHGFEPRVPILALFKSHDAIGVFSLSSIHILHLRLDVGEILSGGLTCLQVHPQT